MITKHQIHSEAGQLGGNATSIADARSRAREAFKSAAASGIVLHFHGGLVSQSSAEETAKLLAEEYQSAFAYPLFFVWESGFLEAILNNLHDIKDDSVFRELVKKASEWAAKKGGGALVTRGDGSNLINEEQLRADFDDWFNGKAAAPPLIVQADQDKLKGIEDDLEIEDLARQIEDGLENDPDFKATMAGLAQAAGRLPAEATRTAAEFKPRAVKVLVDEEALDQLVPEKQTDTTKGVISWIKVAKFVAVVVVAVLKRFKSGRDHGPYTTAVEEVLRAAYLSKVGQVIWNQMKKDAGVDAFNGENAVGDIVLNEWKLCLNEGMKAPRITLVGHSTGAIFINSWLKRSSEIIPALKYDVVLLAPACRATEFAATLSSHAGQIDHFRMFCMQDELEQNDVLVKIIYPRSLLYFVSGVVEGDVDVELLGMQRFLANEALFNGDHMKTIRAYLKSSDNAVWSVTTAPVPGRSSDCKSHGAFDDHGTLTIGSVKHVLQNGFV